MKNIIYLTIFLFVIILGLKSASAATVATGKYVYVSDSKFSSSGYLPFLARSDNSGVSFTGMVTITPFTNLSRQNIAVSDNGKYVYFVNKKSEDFGITFTNMGTAIVPQYVATNGVGDLVFIADASGNIYKSSDHGGTFKTASKVGYSSFSMSATKSNISVSSSGQYVYVSGIETYYLKSTNYGESFTKVASPDPTKVTSDIAVSGSGEIVYMTQNSNIIYKGTNYGALFANVFQIPASYNNKISFGEINTDYNGGNVYALAGGISGFGLGNLLNVAFISNSYGNSNSWRVDGSIQGTGNYGNPGVWGISSGVNTVYMLVAWGNSPNALVFYKSTNTGSSFSATYYSPILGGSPYIPYYNFKDIAINKGGDVGDPPTISSFNLSACGDTTTTSNNIKLDWQTVGAKLVYLQRYNSSTGNWDFLNPGGTNASSGSGLYTDTNITVGTNYQYRIYATNDYGVSSVSNQSVVAKSCQPPGKPVLKIAPICNKDVPVNHLDWTAVSPLPTASWKYDIYRNGIILGQSNSLSFDDTDVIAGQNYEYYVRAKNSDTVFTDSSTITTTTAKCNVDVSITEPIDGASKIVNNDVTFIGVAVDNGDPASVFTYAWDFGDGTTGIGVPAIHPYTTLGEKTIKLTATNTHRDNMSGEKSIKITISSLPPPPPPVGVDFLGVFVGNSITINRTNTLSIVYDSNVANNPPPGFTDFFAPSWSEVAP